MIKLCTCKSEMQDKLYGKFFRVKNICKKGSACRCTVCGKEESISVKSVEVQKEKEKK